jgi:hypothetical protein
MEATRVKMGRFATQYISAQFTDLTAFVKGVPAGIWNMRQMGHCDEADSELRTGFAPSVDDRNVVLVTIKGPVTLTAGT